MLVRIISWSLPPPHCAWFNTFCSGGNGKCCEWEGYQTHYRREKIMVTKVICSADDAAFFDKNSVVFTSHKNLTTVRKKHQLCNNVSLMYIWSRKSESVNIFRHVQCTPGLRKRSAVLCWLFAHISITYILTEITAETVTVVSYWIPEKNSNSDYVFVCDFFCIPVSAADVCKFNRDNIRWIWDWCVSEVMGWSTWNLVQSGPGRNVFS